MSFYKGKKVLVTGGAGFIGGALTHRLLAHGARVEVMDDLSVGTASNVPLGVRLISRPVYDRLAVFYAVRGKDVVFHLACCNQQIANHAPELDALTNIMGTMHVSHACAKQGVPMVYTSSCSVYGTAKAWGAEWRETDPTVPVTPYGLSKLTGERYSLMSGGSVRVARLSNVYGEGMLLSSQYCGVMGKLAKAVARNARFTLSSDTIRDYTHIDDVVDGLLKLGEYTGTETGPFNFGTGIGTSVSELMGMFDITDKVSANPRPEDVIEWRTLNSDLAQSLYLWSPKVPLEKGISNLILWAKQLPTNT